MTDRTSNQRVYAWLGYWRDKMPPEAVSALQDILGPLTYAGETSAQQALAKIAAIIERVEARCMAVDGPVLNTRLEMTDDELRQIWLATGAECPNCQGRGLHEVNFDAQECKPCGGTGRARETTARPDPLADVRWICSKCSTVNGIDDIACLGGCGTVKANCQQEGASREAPSKEPL